ncbi:unnamed protein product, partial [Amoebophrya sp. A120]
LFVCVLLCAKFCRPVPGGSGPQANYDQRGAGTSGVACLSVRLVWKRPGGDQVGASVADEVPGTVIALEYHARKSVARRKQCGGFSVLVRGLIVIDHAECRKEFARERRQTWGPTAGAPKSLPGRADLPRRAEAPRAAKIGREFVPDPWRAPAGQDRDGRDGRPFS